MEKICACIKNIGVYHSFEKMKPQLCFFLKNFSSLTCVAKIWICEGLLYCTYNIDTRGSDTEIEKTSGGGCRRETWTAPAVYRFFGDQCYQCNLTFDQNDINLVMLVLFCIILYIRSSTGSQI